MGDRRLAEIITPDVIAVSPDTPVRAGLAVMRDRGISCLVVAEAGVPVGIVTERDIVWGAAHRGETFADRTMGELMTSPVVTVDEDTMLVEAYHLLARKRLRHLVLVDAAGKARGVLTQSDLIESLGHDALTEMQRV